MKNLNWKNKVKVLVAMSMLASALAGVATAGAAAKSKTKIVSSDMPVKVLYNARQVASDVKPKVVEGAVLVPIRFIGEKIGSKITVAKNNKDISIEKGLSVVNVTINSNVATINGKKVTLNAKVLAESGRTLVPLQALNGLGVPVEWDAITRFVWVGSKEVPLLEDVAPKAVSIDQYKKLFKGNEILLNVDGKSNRDTVTLIDDSIFPFKTSDLKTFYRYDLAYDILGQQYIKATTTDKGITETKMFFMTSEKLLYRQAVVELRENATKDVRIHYFPIVSITDLNYYDDKNYKNFKLKNIQTIYIHTSYPSILVYKPSWR
ncbi:copper amine oxidase N-terminal domain-containing protein [Paenibacillus spongiae]|uniref:Copper amine oxidase N-terminal domain-containing protein n=1 Tax=Paenibacillus spongiae TaxID=2909671 RepID=A0ABY5S8K5_9BACL|nr:copper amine oxidase N-terminal domain-containing protein [Paenibacillus spongiae]UVI28663.1 copper amine oxidase N-terminal domain-containing protein [Paenibacillus spongiae]